MSVHQLSSQNFKVVGRNRKTLNVNLSGNVLVFFKMQGCAGCGTFEPIFHQLASANNDHINYAVCDLSNHREVVAMSRQTATPIQAVPLIILYVDGNPLAKYTGKKSIPALKSFTTKALQHAPSVQSQNFMPPQQKEGSGGMYGNGNYNHPPMSPQQGQSGVNQQHNPSDGKIWMPEIGKAPSMQGVVKGGGGSQYAYLNDIDEDDEEKLSVPEQVTPHNVPWESQYKKIGTLD